MKVKIIDTSGYKLPNYEFEIESLEVELDVYYGDLYTFLTTEDVRGSGESIEEALKSTILRVMDKRS